MPLANHELFLVLLPVAFALGTVIPVALSLWQSIRAGIAASVVWSAVGLWFTGNVIAALFAFLIPALVLVIGTAAVRSRRIQSQS